MSDSKDSYVSEVLVGQVTNPDTCGIWLKQKGGNDTFKRFSVVGSNFLAEKDIFICITGAIWITRIFDFWFFSGNFKKYQLVTAHSYRTQAYDGLCMSLKSNNCISKIKFCNNAITVIGSTSTIILLTELFISFTPDHGIVITLK